MQTVSWMVAALVILINGYLLVDFFSSELSGVFFMSIVTTFSAAYVCFIVYLVTRSVSFSSLCAKAKTILGS